MARKRKASRRRYGTGSISERPDGRFCASLRLGLDPATGRYRRWQEVFRTREEAEDALDRAVQQKRRGLDLNSRRQPLSTYLSTWLEEVVRPRVRPQTVARYQDALRVGVLPHRGEVPLDSLSVRDVERMLRAMERQGLARNTLVLTRAVLSAALHNAQRWDLLDRNVAALATPPRGRPKRPGVALTVEQTARFLEAIRGHRHEHALAVGLSLGLRVGEVCALRWEDVRENRAEVHIRQTLAKERGEGAADGLWTAAPTKTKSGDRTLALLPSVARRLQLRRAEQTEERLRYGREAWQDTGFVFTRPNGWPLPVPTLRHSLYRVLERAGLPRMRPHDAFRHTAATLLLEAGVHLKVVQEILGHANIQLTADTYSHVVPKLMEDAFAAMERLVSGEGGQRETG
jgi:integrase